MSYADQAASGRKTTSLVIVVLLHLALGYAFVTGLAFNVIKKAAQDLKTFDVEEAPPPPPQAPPPPPPTPRDLPPPPIIAPPPIVQTPTVAPTIITAPAPPVIHVEAKPAPPPPPSAASPLKPRGNPNDWLSADDYPSGAQREGAEGTTGFRLEVDGNGKVTGCQVTSSSGNAELDAQTCKLLPRRARFTPAKDAAGNGIPQVYSSRTRWVVPKD